MQNTNVPTKIPLPFANTGTRNTIPETTAGVSTPGLASFDVGFPSLTFTNPSAGGVPPAGADFNGVLWYLASIARWSNAGAGYTYDSAFSADTNVSGYPKGARLLRATLDGYWINQTEGNSTNPDTGGAGWAPAEGQLRAAVISVTATGALTAAQTGSLVEANSTTAITITLPSASGLNGQTFTIYNVNTGAATLASAGGTFNGASVGVALTGFVLSQYMLAQMVSDGTNWIVSNYDAPAGSLKPNIIGLTASSSLTAAQTGSLVELVSTSAATVTLPAATGLIGQSYQFLNFGSATWTLAAASGSFVGGGVNGTTANLASLQTACVVSDGVNWVVLQLSSGASSLAQSGYQKLPSGLIIQWGAQSCPTANTQTTFTFPVAFSSAFYTLTCSPFNSGGITSAQGYIISNSQYSLLCTTASISIAWVAFGK